VTSTVTRSPALPARPAPLVEAARTGRVLPAWPVTVPLLAYPLWWAAGLGVLVFSAAAAVMLVLLVRAARRGRRLRLPPGFPLWLVFLLVVVGGLAVLDVNPVGTLPLDAGGRLLGAGFRIGEYLTATVVLLYAGNLNDTELPRRRMVRLLGWLFALTVAGGLLGVVAGSFAFTSPVEWLLPARVRADGFVQSLVHPYAAQLMDLGDGVQPRPSAPWGYTNTWGNNFCLLVGWFVVACRDASRPVWGWLTLLVGLAVAVVPVIFSLNRGLWIGVAVAAAYVALRLAANGRLAALGALLAATALVGVVVAASPLGSVINDRLDHGKSNGVRTYLTQRAVTGVLESPVIGYGTTRTTAGGRHSITVGESATCARCGNFTIGGNGQLWQLLYAHGLLGTVSYLGFFAVGLWRFRRDNTAVGIAGGAVIVGSLTATLWYNALVTPLIVTLLGYALLWRQHIQEESR